MPCPCADPSTQVPEYICYPPIPSHILWVKPAHSLGPFTTCENERPNSSRKFCCCCCSVTKSCLTLCSFMDYSTPSFPVVTISLSLLKLMSIESVMHPVISSSVAPFSSCPQSFPASGSFPVSQLFVSGGQSVEASALSSVLPVTIQDWFPLRLNCFISLQSKGLPRMFSITTIQNHQFFGTHPSLWSNSSWLLENHSFDYTDLGQQSDISAF